MINQIVLHFNDALQGAQVRGNAQASHLYNGILLNKEKQNVEVHITRVPENLCPDSQFVKDVLKFIRKAK